MCGQSYHSMVRKEYNSLKSKDIALLGKGIYTVAEAARLARVPAARLSRWVGGYERLGVSYPPLWIPELDVSEDGVVSVVSFADLMESMVISAFYSHGVQIQTVRKAIENAKEEFGIERPFSSERFQTDGKRIFIDLKDIQPNDNSLMDMVSTQRAFREIVQPTFKNIDFQNHTAVRWWPLGKGKSIVVDPKRALGKPMTAITGVPAETLVDALNVQGENRLSNSAVASVSRLFDVPKNEVRDAAEFAVKYAA